MKPALRSSLDHITTTLFKWDPTNRSDIGYISCIGYIEQLSFLFFLKIIDEEESRREQQLLFSSGVERAMFPGESSRYRWSKWRFMRGIELQEFIRDEVFPYMASLANEDSQVAAYFQDARFEIDDPVVLATLVEQIDAISFTSLDADVKGDIYEYLLHSLSLREGSILGQFRTPHQIRVMMVQMLDPDLGDSIFDPASGTGGLLIDAVNHILAKHSDSARQVTIYDERWLDKGDQAVEEAERQMPTLQTYRKGAGERIQNWSCLEDGISGIEASRQMMRISMMNLVFHGIRKANIQCANAVADMDEQTDSGSRKGHKIILSTPPFGGVMLKATTRGNLSIDSKRRELLFLRLVVEFLAPGGMAAILVPEGVLFGSGIAHIELRRKILEHFDLLAVVSLPAGLFKPYSAIKSSVLVFRRPLEEATANRNGVVVFAEIRNDGFDPYRMIQGHRVETPDKNDIPGWLRQWKSYRDSGFQKPPGVKAGVVLPAGSDDPTCWWAPMGQIAENEFNLSASRYKPLTNALVSDADPAAMIASALRLEREIVSDLERLLNEVEDIK